VEILTNLLLSSLRFGIGLYEINHTNYFASYEIPAFSKTTFSPPFLKLIIHRKKLRRKKYYHKCITTMKARGVRSRYSIAILRETNLNLFKNQIPIISLLIIKMMKMVNYRHGSKKKNIYLRKFTGNARLSTLDQIEQSLLMCPCCLREM